MSDSEPDTPPIKKSKRPVTEKQMGALKKGMAALKSKREAIAVERDDYNKKMAAGEIPPETPAPKLIPKQKTIVKKVSVKPEPILVIEERKKPVMKPKVMTDDLKQELASLRAEMSALKKPAEVKIEEKIVEKPVEVFRERVVTGSALLDAVFKFK